MGGGNGSNKSNFCASKVTKFHLARSLHEHLVDYFLIFIELRPPSVLNFKIAFSNVSLTFSQISIRS